MPSNSSEPRFKLYYWPIPFRGCFARYLFAYRGVALLEETGFEENNRLRRLHPGEQDIPYMGPPVLEDLVSGRSLSQMPAIVLYVSQELDYIPGDPFEAAMCLKVLMDCNDVLMEICRYNGSTMWERDEWKTFRSQRLPRWLAIFEESLNRDLVGRDTVTFADIGVYALFGNMMRCLPELEPDVIKNAPGIHELCKRLSSEPALAEYVAGEEQKYAKQYCGGQIEASIREMLELDAAS